MRVLILAPVGRDAALLADTLLSIEVVSSIYGEINSLIEALAEGAGAAIIAEEAISANDLSGLRVWISSQPPWADLPFIILTSGGRATRESQMRAAELKLLGNVTLIERPARPETVLSSVQAVLRARMRQYEIRRRQEELLEANADLEQFAHSASHDLREPLRSIGIYSELLDRQYGKLLDQKGGEFLSLIRSGVMRMDALLSDLLEYAHASSISEDGPIDPVDAGHALASALENLAAAIRQCDAEIKSDCMPIVRMHESHLSQIFQNLIGNAIKYRSESVGVRVNITASKVENYWLFRIADNGIGIAPEYRETIFGLFKRLHTNAKYGGTGMGLAICKRIVERYRGKIWVQAAPGRGSEFFFTIPE